MANADYARSYWENGYATDAVRQAVAYAFDERRLHRVEVDVVAFNDVSRHVLEKSGFRYEGTKREAAFLDREYVDLSWYGLLADGWSREQ